MARFFRAIGCFLVGIYLVAMPIALLGFGSSYV